MILVSLTQLEGAGPTPGGVVGSHLPRRGLGGRERIWDRGATTGRPECASGGIYEAQRPTTALLYICPYVAGLVLRSRGMPPLYHPLNIDFYALVPLQNTDYTRIFLSSFLIIIFLFNSFISITFCKIIYTV